VDASPALAINQQNAQVARASASSPNAYALHM
jgi:hypothetical protein